MAEDVWFKCNREFFVPQSFAVLGIDEKKLNKAIEAYNKFLEKSLLEESPYVAEDLQLAYLKSKVAAIENKYKGDEK